MESSTSAGGVIFTHEKYPERSFGTVRYRLLLCLYFLGMIGSAVWMIVSYLASVPSSTETMRSSDTSVIFTIMMSFNVLLLLTSLIILFWSTGENRLRKITKSVQGKPYTLWEGISTLNRRRINSASVLITFAVVGLLITQVTFLASRTQPYNVHFSDFMFDNTSAVIQQDISTIGGTCQTDIETRCAITSFDNYLAQAFINTNHAALILTIFLFYGYWELFLSLYWLNGSIHKEAGEIGYGVKIGAVTNPIDVSSMGGTLLVTHQMPGKAKTDFSIKVFNVALIITVLVFTVLWIFQLITLAGIYDGLCRFLDKFLVFWITDMTLYGAAFVVFVIFLANNHIKNTVYEDTPALQRDGLSILVIFFLGFSIMLACTGLIWFIGTSTLTVYEIPTAILCRTAGDFRTYNAIVVFFSLIFLFSINEIFEYYFLQRLKVGSIMVERGVVMMRNE